MNSIRIDWRRGGYFFETEPLKTAPRPWQQWAHIFERVRQGDFSDAQRLLDVFFSTDNRLLRDACCRLLGDAGSTEAIRGMVTHLQNRFASFEPVGGDDALDLSNALAAHGQLLFVPEILRIFEWNLGVPDSRIFALHLSQMLEPRWGPIAECPPTEAEFSEYKKMVMGRVQELSQSLGSEQAYVFMGQELHVPEIARLLLDNLGASHFEEATQWLLRRRFEASTGINCTRFFQEGRFQSLTAAAVLEDFLSSDESRKFIPGRKYFFGWLVP
ncbi:hypothetical protein HPC49_06510 [Pyxidicoccus fallax]|uniref:Uncharacterized protein n=1 Tax=Pyxidicoccus fallax TaxID=394095 RepID=A0A848LI54_9BACT|nr:hypothetical protein [Pyxidicoccus fallax]NMO17395.1 hypothetical protein [Pyxidicoccus fallax]NPC77906.1 hypothetical protein [Pyxidicoccus fallax]